MPIKTVFFAYIHNQYIYFDHTGNVKVKIKNPKIVSKKHPKILGGQVKGSRINTSLTLSLFKPAKTTRKLSDTLSMYQIILPKAFPVKYTTPVKSIVANHFSILLFLNFCLSMRTNNHCFPTCMSCIFHFILKFQTNFTTRISSNIL